MFDPYLTGAGLDRLRVLGAPLDHFAALPARFPDGSAAHLSNATLHDDPACPHLHEWAGTSIPFDVFTTPVQGHLHMCARCAGNGPWVDLSVAFAEMLEMDDLTRIANGVTRRRFARRADREMANQLLVEVLFSLLAGEAGPFPIQPCAPALSDWRTTQRSVLADQLRTASDRAVARNARKLAGPRTRLVAIEGKFSYRATDFQDAVRALLASQVIASSAPTNTRWMVVTATPAAEQVLRDLLCATALGDVTAGDNDHVWQLVALLRSQGATFTDALATARAVTA